MPDLPGTPAAAGPAIAPSTSAPAPSPAGGSSGGSSGIPVSQPGSSGLAAPSPAPASSSGLGGSATPAPSPGAFNFRETIRGLGVDTSRFQDDQSAMQQLALAYQQNQQNQDLARYGQEYLRNASEFQAWQRARQEEQQRLQASQQQWWKAPEYDPTWASRLTRDPTTGEIRPVPGAPADLVSKYQQWAEHQRSFLDRFAQDPIQAIRPGIEQVVQQVAGQMVQQQLTAFREQNEAREFIAEHSPWLHARDAQNNLILDPRTGKPALSELGQRFAGYVRQGEQMGLRDVASVREHALGLVQRDFMLSQVRQQQPAAPAAPAVDPALAARNNFLQQHNGTPPAPAVAAPAGNVNGTVPPASGARGLAEMLMREMQAQGFAPGQLIT